MTAGAIPTVAILVLSLLPSHLVDTRPWQMGSILVDIVGFALDGLWLFSLSAVLFREDEILQRAEGSL